MLGLLFEIQELNIPSVIKIKYLTVNSIDFVTICELFSAKLDLD